MKLVKDQIESLRYINHLWPVVVLRLYVSYFFFSSYYEMQSSNFLTQPKLAVLIDENLYSSGAPSFIERFFSNYAQESWSFTSGLMMNVEWLLGLLFLIGFLNRPGAMLGLVYLYVISFVQPAVEVSVYGSVSIILLVLLLFGSGRVGGVDYFFYKRKRGLLW